MKPNFYTIMRAVVNAQRASDAGKGIYVIPDNSRSASQAQKRGYRSKDFWILRAIQQINSVGFNKSRTRFHVESDKGDSVIVYFLFMEVNESGKRSAMRQISFHVPYIGGGDNTDLYEIRKYLGKTPRIRWNGKIGESRKLAIYLAQTYNV
jgi:hypothetical protein